MFVVLISIVVLIQNGNFFSWAIIAFSEGLYPFPSCFCFPSSFLSFFPSLRIQLRSYVPFLTSAMQGGSLSFTLQPPLPTVHHHQETGLENLCRERSYQKNVGTSWQLFPYPSSRARPHTGDATRPAMCAKDLCSHTLTQHDSSQHLTQTSGRADRQCGHTLLLPLMRRHCPSLLTPSLYFTLSAAYVIIKQCDVLLGIVKHYQHSLV